MTGPPYRAKREVELAMLKQVNAELAKRGATDCLDIAMSQELRGEHCVLIFTPDVGEPFEVLFPYLEAFPQILAALPPQGIA